MPRIWINDLINRAIAKPWCVNIGCTTCGCLDFRRALKTALNVVPPDRRGGFEALRLTPEEAGRVVDQLRHVDPDALSDACEGEEAIKLLLVLVREAVGHRSDREVQEQLAGTYAGRFCRRPIPERFTSASFRRPQPTSRVP